MKRVALNFALGVSLLFFPWWCTVACAIAGLVLFGSFYELIAWGVFADALYGGTSTSWLSAQGMMSIRALIVVAIAARVQSIIRFS